MTLEPAYTDKGMFKKIVPRLKTTLHSHRKYER